MLTQPASHQRRCDDAHPFCESFVPWPKTEQRRRQQLQPPESFIHFAGPLLCATSQLVAMVKRIATSMPTIGERKINSTGLTQPQRMSARYPACATAAPPYPPINACDELVGNPRIRVIRFQMMAPSSPARSTCCVDHFDMDQAFADRSRDRRAKHETPR